MSSDLVRTEEPDTPPTPDPAESGALATTRRVRARWTRRISGQRLATGSVRSGRGSS